MGPGTHLPGPRVVVPGNGWNVEFLPGPGVKIPGIPPPVGPGDGNVNPVGTNAGVIGVGIGVGITGSSAVGVVSFSDKI